IRLARTPCYSGIPTACGAQSLVPSGIAEVLAPLAKNAHRHRYRNDFPSSVVRRPAELRLFAARRDACNFAQFAMNPRHPFDLAFRGKSLVKSFVPKIAYLFAPGRQPLSPTLHAVFRFRVF